MERERYVNLVEDVDETQLSSYLVEVIRSALAVEGIVVDDAFIESIIYDDLSSIYYKGTNGEGITVQEISLIENVRCAVELLFILLKADAYNISFAAVTSLISQILRREAIQGVHIPVTYATNLKGFGDTIQEGLDKIVSRYATVDFSLKTEEVTETCFEVCSNLINYLAGSGFFTSGNSTLAYLVAVGFMYMKTKNIFLVDYAQINFSDVKRLFKSGDLFYGTSS